MNTKKIISAYRVAVVASSSAGIAIEFANGLRHTPLPAHTFPRQVDEGDFLVSYKDAKPEFMPAAQFAALIGVSRETALSISTVGVVSILPVAPFQDDCVVGTSLGGFGASREWMVRYSPELGELVADTDSDPRYLPVRELPRRSSTAVGGENTVAALIAEMDSSGASGWAHRLRSLLKAELQRRETFVIACTDALSAEDLAVFREQWEKMRTGAIAMPVLVAPPAPVGTPAAHWRTKGENDPHAGQYDGERAALAYGHLSDDELANALYLCDHRRSFDSIGYVTAAKERIRWLSRALERVLAAPAPALAAASVPPPVDPARHISGVYEPLLSHIFARGEHQLPQKVTREALQALIVSTVFEVRPDGRTTLCEITTLNGTTERGESTPALSGEYVKELGEKYAFEHALDKLWPKEGYLLRELHFRARRSAAV